MLAADDGKFINWIKDYVFCDELRIEIHRSSPNRDKQLLDFFAIGSRCASKIVATHCQVPKAVVVGLVQKFIGLKNCDEGQLVESIRGSISKHTAEALKSDYAKFFVKEQKDGGNTEQVFEFVNKDVEKKLHLTTTNYIRRVRQVIAEIKNIPTIEPKKMLRFTLLAQKRAGLENYTQIEPKAKKRRTDDRTLNIATLDNGTMVEAFKYLSYIQLAKSSLVSRKFSNLIRTHRHKLALLDVEIIYMYHTVDAPASVKIFDKNLSPEEYNEWVIRKGYSKQILLKGQVDDEESVQYDRNDYEMRANYKDPRHCDGRTTVFYAHVEFSHENWPLFQHFIRLLTDPFIYIRALELISRIDVSLINLLNGEMDRDYYRLECGALVLYLNGINPEGSVRKFIGWIKNHMLCFEIRIYPYSSSNYDEELLDLFMTGGHCTSAIDVSYYYKRNYEPTTIIYTDLSNAIKTLLQKFMDLKKCGENQMIESIQCSGAHRAVKLIKRDYAKFIVKEEIVEDQWRNSTVRILFELINNQIGKKLQITIKNTVEHDTYFLLKITNL